MDELEFLPGNLDGFYFYFHTAHSLSKNSFFVWGLLKRISDLALGTRYDPKAL